MAWSPHRRAVLRLLAATADWSRLKAAQSQGLGGSGVIGTIRGLAPLTVSRLRIATAPDVAVRIDGDRAVVSDLAVGQVAQLVGRDDGAGLTAARIDVTSEVVGPVETAAPGRLIVLGQRVLTAGLAGEWRPGTRVAVFGLRRLDGVIVASLVQSRGPGPDRVAGPLRRGDDGALTIGHLRLLGGETLHPGGRLLVTGTAEGGALRVMEASQTAAPFPPGLWSVSVEAYLGRTGAALTLGSGLPVAGRADAAVPGSGSIRAILTANLGADGGLILDHLDVLDGTGHADEAVSDLRYEPDRIDLRNLTTPARENSGWDPGTHRTGSRVLDTRPGGDISLPQDNNPLRVDNRPPRTGTNGLATGTGSGTRIGPGVNGPTYPGAGGPEAPSNIPGFRR